MPTVNENKPQNNPVNTNTIFRNLYVSQLPGKKNSGTFDFFSPYLQPAWSILRASQQKSNDNDHFYLAPLRKLPSDNGENEKFSLMSSNPYVISARNSINKFYGKHFYEKSFYPHDSFRIAMECGAGVLVQLLDGKFTSIIMQHPFFAKLDPAQVGTHNGISYKHICSRSFRFSARFIVPIAEEFIFRGLCLQVSKDVFQKECEFTEEQATVGSVLVSSTVFGAVHSKGLRLSAFIGGLFYGGITAACDGSLWPSTVAHMLNNNIATSQALRSFKLKK
ncbi:MAG TPA: CPBP family intramembrane glutamic endopeptidase [Gammaproteobacteria bacterium]|jgi:hypothetical protein|nr:CPBP family intramembrane glutamic endopeptidase [Gammaproteobacteria bacterium]